MEDKRQDRPNVQEERNMSLSSTFEIGILKLYEVLNQTPVK